MTQQGLFRACSGRDAMKRQEREDAKQYRVYSVTKAGTLYKSGYIIACDDFETAKEKVNYYLSINPGSRFAIAKMERCQPIEIAIYK